MKQEVFNEVLRNRTKALALSVIRELDKVQ